MADRHKEPSDRELERELRELGKRLERLRAPDVSHHVLRSLREEGFFAERSRRRAFSSRWMRVAACVVVVVFSIALVLTFSPIARTAVAEWFGVPGIEISFLERSPKPQPEPLGRGLDLGRRVSLDDARGQVSYRILLPTLPELGEPDEVYVKAPPPGGQVSLVYRSRPGLPPASETGVSLLFSEFRGETGETYFRKLLGPEAEIETITVNGNRGFWIEGEPHAFIYRNAEGGTHREDLRLAANALIWEQNGLTLRLEGDLPKGEALRVAESVR